MLSGHDAVVFARSEARTHGVLQAEGGGDGEGSGGGPQDGEAQEGGDGGGHGRSHGVVGH